MVNIYIKLLCNPLKNEQDIDRTIPGAHKQKIRQKWPQSEAHRKQARQRLKLV
jgi:hypothetical protein